MEQGPNVQQNHSKHCPGMLERLLSDLSSLNLSSKETVFLHFSYVFSLTIVQAEGQGTFPLQFPVVPSKSSAYAQALCLHQHLLTITYLQLMWNGMNIPQPQVCLARSRLCFSVWFVLFGGCLGDEVSCTVAKQALLSRCSCLSLPVARVMGTCYHSAWCLVLSTTKQM